MEEITISTDPEWANEFKKIIMEKYNLSLLDAACITGRAEKTVKKLKKEWVDKACEWLNENGYLAATGWYTIKGTLDDFCKAMEEQL